MKIFDTTTPKGALFAFRLPGFSLVFAYGMCSAVALSVRLVIHGWLVLSLTNDSPFWVGVAAILMGGGQVAFSPIAGVIVDRMQRREVLFFSALAGGVVAGFIGVASYFEFMTLAIALITAAVMGALQSLTWTASHAILYDVAGPRHLLNASAIWRLGFAPMMIFGSIAMGFLIEWAGIWLAYIFMAGAHGGASLLILPSKIRSAIIKSPTSFFQELKEGLLYAAKTLNIRVLLTFSFVMEALGFSFLTMIPVMAKNVLLVGPFALGLLSASAGFGSLIGLILMTFVGASWAKSKVILICALSAGFCLIGFSVSRNLALSIFFATGSMAFLMAYDLTLATLLQLIAPTEMRGRIISIYSMSVALTSVGGFFMGALGTFIGVPLALSIGGVSVVANTVGRWRAISKIDKS